MYTQLWFWLYVVSVVLAGTTPRTNKLGSFLGGMTLVARFVFVVLLFFYAPYWWWGLVLIAVYFLTIRIIPRVDSENESLPFMLYSIIGSYINPILVVLMFVFFFK